MSSNNWVIHGKHTESGFPLIANDPHLNMAMPAPWTMNELSWEDKYLIGVSVPGIPSVAIGRNKDLAWAITATLVDNSDLWEEEVNAEGTKYKVDGEWRDIRLIKEQIKVKGEKTIDFVVGFTHRGSLMDYDVLSSATQLIFAGTTPIIDRNIKYSFGWAAQLPVHDTSVSIMTMLGDTKTVKEAFDRFDGQ
jgi:acyl-homoserine lactone acylase PvdQ